MIKNNQYMSKNDFYAMRYIYIYIYISYAKLKSSSPYQQRMISKFKEQDIPYIKDQ